MKIILRVLLIILLSSCSRNDVFNGGVVASFSQDFKNYATFGENIGEDLNKVHFQLYSIPDSLSKIYLQRDSLMRLAVEGDAESLSVISKNSWDEGFSVDVSKFTILKEYTIEVPSKFYGHSYEKMIWDKNESLVYLPNLDITIQY
ncbi:hypothetical protein [Gracilimonas sediminicola]|uniref:Lipoprotein n=1 Tax=Gracilimonas sediminicola TaxID=2952158 RepID=A0A9X2L4N6_9BACT|nr:hypothetical protein [Gracilimonas sediminicola]MCP9292190.1 hypothetical protein [Gracilimonas sediminicola]